MPKKLYFLTTEIVPFANVTSLAMFSTRVPLALQEKGHDTRLHVHPGISISTLALLLHAIRAGVAVLVRKPEKATLVIKEGEVDSPRIDSQRGDIVSVTFHGKVETLQDLAVEIENIPDEAAREVRPRVVEAMDVLEFESLEIGAGGHDAATAGAKVNREEHLFFHSFS